MSYILEALKKAQAERQLGSAPTIHAMSLQPTTVGQARPSRTPLLVGLACAVLAACVAGALFWMRAAPVPGPAPVTAAAPPPPAVVTPVAPAPVFSAPVSAPMPTPVPAPIEVPVRAVTPQVALAPPPPKPKPAPQPEALRVVQAPAPVEAVSEENYPLLRELPEAVQRDIPRVAIGGYIYSKNPADRLLLVDKVLRREGEDVGAGQILEKLQSKAAVLNYRGTRYRIPY